MSNWYMEYVTSIFCTVWSDEDEREIQRGFPHLRLLCACGYYSISCTPLEGQITARQTLLLTRLKTEGKILDWYARDQVHWSQMRPGDALHPLAVSPIPPGQ